MPSERKKREANIKSRGFISRSILLELGSEETMLPARKAPIAGERPKYAAAMESTRQSEKDTKIITSSENVEVRRSIAFAAGFRIRR